MTGPNGFGSVRDQDAPMPVFIRGTTPPEF